jgi:DNA-binding transcriptional LysR family regulator
MRRRLPPLEQIEAFIEAARARTFRDAAERCALSPAAFSRRIQAFSDFIGLTLFERCPGGLRLTEAGRRCLEELEPAYVELRRAAAVVAGADAQDQSVRLSLSHSLAVGWLIPRLDAFHVANPGIELSLRTQRDASEIRYGNVDLGICFSDIDLSSLTSQPLLTVIALPVAAPQVAAEMVADGGRLGDRRLLAVSSPPDQWRWWMDLTGVRIEPGSTSTFDFLHALYEVASEGLGVALASSPTVQPHLQAGRLAPVGLPAARFPGGYQLAATPERRRRRAVGAVWRWLDSEARSTPDLSEYCA